MGTNWIITFEVSGNHLSDAQAAVHRLKGVRSMGAKPIFEKDPSAPAAERGSSTEAILRVLGATKPSTAAMVSQATGIDVRKVHSRLAALVNQKKVRRLAPGKFVKAKGKSNG
jgi:hypothetical protein